MRKLNTIGSVSGQVSLLLNYLISSGVVLLTTLAFILGLLLRSVAESGGSS